MARRSRQAGPNSQREGNFVSEWFGHRIYPSVANSRQALADQQRERCPFLSEITDSVQTCVKSESSRGVCTISSASNGSRQDWLVCPYRAIDREIFSAVARRLFGLGAAANCLVVAAPSLAQKAARKQVVAKLESGDAVVAFRKRGSEARFLSQPQIGRLSFRSTQHWSN